MKKTKMRLSTSSGYTPIQSEIISQFAFSRSALTLIELVVSLSIIAVLTSLILPAVSAARESARQIHCANNLRQLRNAIASHETVKRRLPSNGGFVEGSKFKSKSGEMLEASTLDFAQAKLFRWGVGKPGAAPDEQTGSWAYAVLPYLDQEIAYEQLLFEASQPIFLCNSRDRQPSRPTIDDVHGHYTSGDWAWSKTDYAANKSAFPGLPKVLTLASLRDGASNTIAIGEKAFNRHEQLPSSWHWDEPIFLGGSDSTVRDGLRIVSDDHPEFRKNWGSAHGGKTCFAFFDGSIHWLSNEIASEVMRDLLSIAGGPSKRMP